MKEDKRKNNGGHKSAGRKPKVDEEKANMRLLAALKAKYRKDDDEDNIVKFLSEFLDTKEGLKFFAEHIIGKPKDKIEADIKQRVIEWAETKTYDSNQETD